MDQITQLERDIGVLNNVIMLSENLMKEGNEEIDTILHGNLLEQGDSGYCKQQSNIGTEEERKVGKGIAKS